MSNLKYRHELKYLISRGEQAALLPRLDEILSRDAHAAGGQYFIRSLYFDDFWQNARAEKLAGTNERKKYRIRIYNLSDEVIHLECKRKKGQYINKISAPLTREEADRMQMGDYSFMAQRPEQVCQDFFADHMLSPMRPLVVVDYDRIPFVYPHGDVRITFDMDIRAGVFRNDLFDPAMPVACVQEPGQLILEVKFTEYLPDVVRELLQLDSCIYTAASKYIMCLDKRDQWKIQSV